MSKDLEKIKSEDLAAQVQDANPANFAIEQEVAALVGATVPAPTEPSADDARELGAQLLVFLRRALLPIRSALRTALAAIYAHLDSRCTDYTPAAYAPFRILPYDPMTTPRAPRTVANLLTALTAFSDRKITGVPDAADGVSLVHLLTDATAAGSVLELTDNNTGYAMNTSRISNLWTIFPNLEVLHDNGTGEISRGTFRNNAKVKTIDMPGITSLVRYESNYYAIGDCENLEEVILPSCTYAWAYSLPDYPCIHNCPKLRKLVLGTLTGLRHVFWAASTAKLIHFEIGAGTACNLDIPQWQPDSTILDGGDNQALFLQNFREHIALRLTANGTGKTLTLSQAVFDTIWNQDGTPKSTDPDSVIYQINKIIKTDKHWSVNRA